LSGTGAGADKVKIQYVGAPRYRIVVAAPDYKSAEEEMKVIADRVISSLKHCGGQGSFHREGK
jgi:translation initiation factor 2 subunit 1